MDLEQDCLYLLTVFNYGMIYEHCLQEACKSYANHFGVFTNLKYAALFFGSLFTATSNYSRHLTEYAFTRKIDFQISVNRYK